MIDPQYFVILKEETTIVTPEGETKGLAIAVLDDGEEGTEHVEPFDPGQLTMRFTTKDGMYYVRKKDIHDIREVPK
jgi:hypothetical protein